MKQTLLFSLAIAAVLMMGAHNASAQGMAVNTSGAAADASSMLDISSTTKGILIPRMTAAQMSPGISSPVQGLMIYNTSANAFYYYNGSAWNAVGSGTVTQVTSGNMSPLFSTSVATGTTTPVISYSLTATQAYSVFTNSTNTTGAPSYGKVVPQALFATGGTTSSGYFYRGDGVWDNTVTTQGNTFNGASQLVQLNGSTQLPAVSGVNVTSLNASNLASGTVNTARLGTGTANGTTVLFGNNTWGTVASGGYVLTSRITPVSVTPIYVAAGSTTGNGAGPSVAADYIVKAGTISKVIFSGFITQTAAGTGQTVTGTIFVNGSSTGITASFTLSSGSLVNDVIPAVTVTPSFAVGVGDKISVEWTQSATGTGPRGNYACSILVE